MSGEWVRYGALLLSGTVLSGKAIFLHRYFHDWRRLRQLTPLAGGPWWEVVIYHLGVTLIVLGVAVGQLYALTLGGFKLNPAISLVLVGLVLLDVALFRIAARLGPNPTAGGGGPDGATLDTRD